MSNDFGTVSVRRDRSREIDILRQQYNRHRESLASLAADAPSEHLAAEYQRLIREIDQALGKLGEMEGRTNAETRPGNRPLMTPPGMITPDATEPAPATSGVPRVALIIAVGVVVLALIGWLLWRASGERPAGTTIRERTDTAPVTETAGAPVTPAPKPVVAATKLTVTPPIHDYGVIRKGTRAVRQFQVTNNGDQALAIEVARSSCRCLYYDYAGTVAPHAKESITVTVDGAKAKAGALHETLSVTAKKDPAATASFDVNAMIK